MSEPRDPGWDEPHAGQEPPASWPDFERPPQAAPAYPFDIYRPDPGAYRPDPDDPPTATFPVPAQPAPGQAGEWWVPGPWQAPPRRPVSHVTGAALATVFLSFPLGAVALYHALQVDRRFDAGDHAGARRASDRAGAWLVWAVAMGLAWVALVLLYFLTRR